MAYDPNAVQTLEMPIEEAKGGIFSCYITLILTCANAISHNPSETDNTPNELIDLMISIVPNAKFRTEIRIKRDERILAETKGLTTNEERGRKIRQINREIMGSVSEYMDRYAGGERTNRISFIIPIKEMRNIMEKANPQHFIEHLEDVKEV